MRADRDQFRAIIIRAVYSYHRLTSSPRGWRLRSGRSDEGIGPITFALTGTHNSCHRDRAGKGGLASLVTTDHSARDTGICVCRQLLTGYTQSAIHSCLSSRRHPGAAPAHATRPAAGAGGPASIPAVLGRPCIMRSAHAYHAS